MAHPRISKGTVFELVNQGSVMRRVGLFWAAWILLAAITGCFLGPISPFILPNILVAVGGWDLVNRVPVYTGATISAVVIGLLAGVLGLFLLRFGFGSRPLGFRVLVILVYCLAVIGSALSYNVLSGGAFLGVVPLCLGGTLAWGASLSVIILIPKGWEKAGRSVL